MRCEFECIFHELDPDIQISYCRSLRRAYLSLSNPILTRQVCKYMNGREFHHGQLHISYASEFSSTSYLKPPSQERIFMQSPPTTPPVGWIARREEFPDINFDIFLALSKLQPNEPLEILPEKNNFPAIVIHPCSDTSDDDLDDVINPIIDQFGNETYSPVEAKRRAVVLHDAILVPGEQQVRRIAGDGDRGVNYGFNQFSV